MDLGYDSLVVLAAVVRTGSFEAAAKSLNVTQSAISQRIKMLEERVGSILVVRGRPCVPTEQGLLLCQHVEQVSLLQHELRERLGMAGSSDTTAPAHVRIGINSDSLATWFPYVIKRAANELNLRLEIIPDDQEFTEQSLRSGDALAVVTSADQPVAGCKRISLGAMEYACCISSELAAEHWSDAVGIEDLALIPSIAFDRKDTLPEQWMMHAFGETKNVHPHLVPSYEGHMSCLLQGIGWGIMPTVSVQPYLDAGTLTEVVPGKRVPVSLHWQSSTQASEVLRQLAELVYDEAVKHLQPDAFRHETETSEHVA